MSDPEVPRPEQPNDVDDVVDSANAGLDAAAAAGADVPGAASDAAETTDAAADAAPVADPDLAAFEEAERDHPGTFSTPALNDVYAADADETAVYTAPVAHEESTIADSAYASADDTETRIVPSEPVLAEAPVVAAFAQQPIFVQAPEPPRERGNRGTAGAIGLLATLAFAILYLGATLGLGALSGDVTGKNIGEAALAPLTTFGFWIPVVVFFLGFWLLGAIINRGRWGRWVIFGIIVGAIAYGGHILGQLVEEPFWRLTASEGAEFVNGQLLTPLAIAAFVFARELTIWFGAWVARSGARKTELNAEAQREYERTLEAGPTLSR
ncbi:MULTISPECIES: ABC transporter [Microbacterium]|uniref:ABC transporter n=1 Tax=Microbacterium TaxID=33882 RepID=UPI000CFA8DAB|nr:MULTISPECIES: ABC transporter [unclassified Microbacterium]PRB10572.1 ABC transporter [Microbacterium sp. MYb72]